MILEYSRGHKLFEQILGRSILFTEASHNLLPRLNPQPVASIDIRFSCFREESKSVKKDGQEIKTLPFRGSYIYVKNLGATA